MVVESAAVALAKDIAFKLNTYGYVDSLTRLSIGEYNKSDIINYNTIIIILQNTTEYNIIQLCNLREFV